MEHTNEIELRSKALIEEYEHNNAEFLAQYDTDDKQIDYYTDLAMKLYKEFQIDGTFTEVGVRKNVQVWFANKKAQMERFRKHPYWQEEAKAIVFMQTETREVDYRFAAEELDQLNDYVAGMTPPLDGDYWIFGCLRDTLRQIADHNPDDRSGVITDEFINVFRNRTSGSRIISKQVAKVLRKGMKITRFVRKCFENVVLHDGKTFDATKLEKFDKYYAKFADSLSELTIQKITLVSLNFLDFMTMSNGNSWASCHFINSNNIFHEGTDASYSGCYKQGCLSYALDEPSFLLYTLPATFKGTDYYRCQKLNRMCCQYDKGILITGKCYPRNEDTLITRYRQMMQLIVSQVEGVPNLWTFSRKTKKIMGFVETTYNSAHYRDYEISDQKPTISICKNFTPDIDFTMTIGHEAYCLDCGEVLSGSDAKWLQCDNHRKTRRCCCCGRRLEEGEGYEIYGDFYCSDHVFYCDFHGIYEPTMIRYGDIVTSDGTKTVCEDAMSSFRQCADCGVYYPKEELVAGHCNNCIGNHPICSHCGAIIDGEVFKNENGDRICKHCHIMGKYNLHIVQKRQYEVGDYVLVAHDVSECHFGTNDKMERYYPNRIVRVRNVSYSGREINISSLDGHNWSWSHNCFAGVVEGATDELIGKTIAEAVAYLASKEEQ